MKHYMRHLYSESLPRSPRREVFTGGSVETVLHPTCGLARNLRRGGTILYNLRLTYKSSGYSMRQQGKWVRL